MAVPASRNLRVTTGVLLLLGGLAAIVFPFISALAVTIGFGAVALAAGVSQLLRVGAAADGLKGVFAANPLQAAQGIGVRQRSRRR